MNSQQLVEIRRDELSTRDADETIDYVSKVYVDNKIEFRRAESRSNVRNTVTRCGEIMATEIRSTIGYVGHLGALTEQVYFEQTLGGSCRMRGGGHDIWQQRHDYSMYPMDAPILAECHNHDVNILHIPKAVLLDLTAQSGIDPRTFRFESLVPIDPRRQQFWAKLFDLVHREVTTADSQVMTELLVQNLSRSLAAAALTVFPNSTMDLERQPGPAIVTASALERAVDYLHAHPARPVTIAELAAHAGVSARALQYAFRSRYSATPLEYLRRLRLEHAHEDLVTAIPGDGRTVGNVAARWGFTQSGRFTQLYTRVYGQPPSRTLNARLGLTVDG